MSEDQVHDDPAIRAANHALSGRRQRQASRFASIELRFTDPRTGPWEVAAMFTVPVASLLLAIGGWCWYSRRLPERTLGAAHAERTVRNDLSIQDLHGGGRRRSPRPPIQSRSTR